MGWTFLKAAILNSVSLSLVLYYPVNPEILKKWNHSAQYD